ncbi:hypothetical protein GWI33_014178 [Rhynchophorus ferrugineus]|uniref:Uncharacterized protein n=1 Tax=Rhynchophorus ferrugineus TaxID=354439 RepID=A0A834I350_RHYFE|nr:hypothetical protein GWI33_014178 [Rhynchophorus ferrugineus]
MTRRRRQLMQLCLLFGGIFLITTGLFIFVYLESIYEHILNEALKFTPTSDTYKAWRTNDPPLDLDLYLFNWTNPEDITNPNIKPHFEEVGPYRVKEVKEKTNITWHDNGTISYGFKKLYFYDPKNSIRIMEDDVVTTINTVPLTVAYQARNFSTFIKALISISMGSISRLYVRKTSKEILFDGYEDSILNLLSNIPLLKVQRKFGIFYGRNDTIDPNSIQSMHIKNDQNFGKQLTWNYKNRTNFYQGHCSDVRGSAGEFYPLNIKKSKIVLYSSELCKYAELEFVREEIIKGVLGYRFTGDNIFDNGTTRPENRCFCVDGCIPSGVLDVSACRQNSPTFLSFPHFHAADPYYTDMISGMKPNRSRHEFYIVIEPKSGIIMEISANMQMNMLLQPVSGLRLYRNMPKIFIPVFYLAQTIELKDDLAFNLRIIQGFPDYLRYSSFFFIMSGVSLIVWVVCLLFNFCQPTKVIKKNFHEELPLNEKIPIT